MDPIINIINVINNKWYLRNSRGWDVEEIGNHSGSNAVHNKCNNNKPGVCEYGRVNEGIA